MLIIHLLLRCLSCGEENEIFSRPDGELEREISCWECGYTNELNDIRVNVYEREF